MTEDKKLYFVVDAIESRGHRILYSVDIRGGVMMLSEKMARGRSGVTPLISERELLKITLSGEIIIFCGSAVSTPRTLVAAFTSFKKASECYVTIDAYKLDSRWAPETAEALESFGEPQGAQCLFGQRELAA